MIHLVLPAFNEEENIPTLLGDLVPRARALDARIIIVDDGSTDGTVEAIREHRGDYPVTVVRHRPNLGVGRAVDSGIGHALEDAADDDAIVTLEADSTTDLGDLQAMLDRFDEGYDLVLASFHAPGGRLVGVNRFRTFLSRSLARCLRTLTGMRDVHTFSYIFRVYRARALRDAIAKSGRPLTREPGFPAAVELLLRLSRTGVRVAEVPTTIDWTRRQGQSKLRVLPVLFAYSRLAVDFVLGLVRPTLHLPRPEPQATIDVVVLASEQRTTAA